MAIVSKLLLSNDLLSQLHSDNFEDDSGDNEYALSMGCSKVCVDQEFGRVV